MKTIMWATALLALSGCAATAAQANQEKTLYVAPKLADCVGVGPMKCMQVKEGADGEWTYFYGGIQGFDYEEGYQYKLQVHVQDLDPKQVPADAPSKRWSLVKILEKTNAQTGETTPLK
ncbi:DUF4377 domain-containing protein [Neisseriaceae bacterium CLB008]|nr:DUF4377 domain-containing protein [Neisseriaceae bacterium]